METYARVNDKAWADWVEKSLHAQVDSVIATRFSDMDFSPEVQVRFNEVALAMLQINAATARAAVEH